MNMRGLLMGCAVAVFVAGCAKAIPPDEEKNTNWLDACTSDDGCREGLSCSCGVCTVTCERSQGCERGVPASCRSTASSALRARCDEADLPGDTAVCIAECERAADCASSALDCVGGMCLPLAVSEPSPEAGPADASAMDSATADASPPAQTDGGQAMDAAAMPDAADAEPACPDGICLEVLATDIGTPAALHMQDGQLYWTWTGHEGAHNYPNNGALYTLVDDEIMTLADGLQWPSEFELDSAYVYLPLHIHDSIVEPKDASWIARIPLSGGEPEIIAEGFTAVNHIAIDDEYAYWFALRGSAPATLWRASQDGSATAEPLMTTDEWPASLEVDAARIYWLDETGPWSAAKDGSNARLLIPTPFEPMLNTSNRDLIVDDEWIYWVRSELEESIIYGIPKDGGDRTELARLPYGWGSIGRPSISMTSDALFWSYYEGASPARTFTLVEWDKAAGHAAELVTDAPAEGRTLTTADDDTIYISTGQGEEDATLMRLPRE
jgi:hypothetical protein